MRQTSNKTMTAHKMSGIESGEAASEAPQAVAGAEACCGHDLAINTTPSLHSEHHNRLGAGPVNTRTYGRSLRTVSQMCHAFAEPGGHGRTQKDTTAFEIAYRRTLKEP